MTPTSDERREVAARLRADHHGYGTEYDFFLHALGMLREGRGPCDWDKVHKRLADLIDPTCRIVSGDADNHMPHCNLCGTGNFDLLPKYCKGCGARIVYNENVN